MGSPLVGIAFFVGILEVCFLYKVVWEEFMLRGGVCYIFRTKLFGEMSTPRRRILLIFRIKSSSVVSTPRGSV